MVNASLVLWHREHEAKSSHERIADKEDLMPRFAHGSNERLVDLATKDDAAADGCNCFKRGLRVALVGFAPAARFCGVTVGGVIAKPEQIEHDDRLVRRQ